MVDEKATIQTRRRYNRVAPLYDLMESLIERSRFSSWREKLWSDVQGDRVLEVGVGTGKNIPYHPLGVEVTAVDLSDGMLRQARERTQRMGAYVGLCLADAQRLPFADGTFDTAAATFVFCSVPDPVLGLREVGRVVKNGGRIRLLEHMRVNRPVIGKLMDLLDPIVVRLAGPHIARRTVENVKKAGWEIERLVDLGFAGAFKLIVGQVR